MNSHLSREEKEKIKFAKNKGTKRIALIPCQKNKNEEMSILLSIGIQPKLQMVDVLTTRVELKGEQNATNYTC